MGKSKKKNRNRTRAAPSQSSTSYLCSMDAYETLCCTGYTKLSQNPEIMSAVNKIADLISSMTIHLMSNTEMGDKRIKNELSKKIDIYPNKYMTRKTFVSAIVRTLLLEGDGNSVVLPTYKGQLIDDLVIIPPGHYTLFQKGYGYGLLINGVEFEPSDVLHYVINPEPEYPWKGTGYRITLKDVAHNLKQAAKTQRGFMESKWKPSMIVKVDALTEEFSSKEGRKKLLEKYIEA